MKKLLKTSCLKIAYLSLVLTMIFSYTPNALAMQENNEIPPQGYWTDKGNYDLQWYDPARQTYTINNEKQLAGLAVIVNGLDSSVQKCNFTGKTINLTHDLNMREHCWTPIGKDPECEFFFPDIKLPKVYFSGIFEGNKHTISNLQTIDKTKEYQGLFGIVIHGTIQHISITESNIIGYHYVGGIAGQLYDNSIIKHCNINIKVNGNNYVGGIAGALQNHSKIQDCNNTGSVISGNYYIGGIAGSVSVNSHVQVCHNTGKISGENYIGGVSGELKENSTVQSCYNTGQSKANFTVGGVAGTISNNSQINACYNIGEITGRTYVGGIAGRLTEISKIQFCYNTGEIKEASHSGGVAGCLMNNSEIQSCYNTGKITGHYQIGGVAGELQKNSTIQSCYNTGEVIGQHLFGGVVGELKETSTLQSCYYCNDENILTNNANDLGTPISLDQMKQSDFAEQLGKDFLYDKEKNLNNGLPALHWHNFNQLIIVKQSNISKVLKARQAYSLRRNTTKNLLNIFFNITDMIDSNLEKGPQ